MNKTQKLDDIDPRTYPGNHFQSLRPAAVIQEHDRRSTRRCTQNQAHRPAGGQRRQQYVHQVSGKTPRRIKFSIRNHIRSHQPYKASAPKIKPVQDFHKRI